jgi:hypothetical protein
MRMPVEAEQSFLAEPHVAVVAIEEPGRSPLAVPIWYSYVPGNDLFILTGTDSLKARLLRSAGTCTLTIDTLTPRTRYVSVACEVVTERPGTVEDARILAERYLPADQVAGFLAFAAEGFGSETVFVLRPTRWRSADLTRS